MRHSIALTLVLFVALVGCGAKTDSTAEVPAGEQAIPNDDVHKTAAQMPADDAQGSGMGGMMAGLNTDIAMDPSIEGAWSGVLIRVVDSETGDEQTYEIQLGGADLLGETGLVLTVQTFVPDFVMDDSGITSRSAETNNPAVRVLISEEGMEDYEGWLFAKMPEIHPYPHTRYAVLLVEGIPSE